MSETVRVRTWRTKTAGDEFGWLLGAARGVVSALGFPQAAALLTDAAKGALERSQLDGLLALWHPRPELGSLSQALGGHPTSSGPPDVRVPEIRAPDLSALGNRPPPSAFTG